MNPVYIARSKDIAARNLGGETMIMSLRDATLFNLNDVGTVIWEAADGQTSLEEIVERKVCAEFDVEPAEALKDAETFVRELAAHEILLLSDLPIAISAATRKKHP
jgi:predicted RecB family endonuclease